MVIRWMWCPSSSSRFLFLTEHPQWVENGDRGVSRVYSVPCILQSILYGLKNSLKTVIVVSQEFILTTWNSCDIIVSEMDTESLKSDLVSHSFTKQVWRVSTIHKTGIINIKGFNKSISSPTRRSWRLTHVGTVRRDLIPIQVTFLPLQISSGL